MKLTLFCNENQNAASTDALNRVLKNKNKEDILVITPENSALWAEEFLANNSQNGAISGIEVTNITKLCQKLYSNVKFASSELSTMLVARSIQLCDLSTYKNPSKRYGVATSLYEIIKLFSQSGIEWPSLEANGNDKALNQKISDIKSVWQKYLEIMPEKMVDGNSKIAMLLAAAKRGYFAGKTVYFIGFDDVSESLMKLIEQICESAKEVVASVVEEDNEKMVNSSVANEFLNIAQKLNLETVFERKSTLQPRSKHIAKNLFAKNKKASEVSGIKIIKCFNRRNESETIALHISGEIHKGCRYKDFEIVVPNIDQYEKYLASELKTYEIPFYFDSPKSIEQHALTKLIDAYFMALSSRNRVQDLISLNKNILLGNDLNNLFLYENFCNKYGIEFNDFASDLKVGADDKNFETISLVHKQLRAQALSFPESGLSVGETIKSLRQFLEVNNIAEALVLLRDRQETEEEKDITERIGEKINELISEIELALGNETLSALQLLEIWRSGARATKLKLIPPTLDAVRICDVSTSKHTATKNLIIMGASEGNFPSFVSDNGILTDAELAKIDKQYKLKVRPTVEHVNELEKFKVAELLSLSDNSILITYPEKIGAEQQNESMCITSLKNICTTNNQPLFVENSVPKNSYLLRQHLLEKAKTIGGAQRVAALGKSKSKNRQTMLVSADVYGSVVAALQKSNMLPKQHENSSNDLSVDLFFQSGKTSISELESYFSCPYLHFARYGLGVKEPEIASMHALDIGNFLHMCLEKITNKFISKGYQMTDQEFSSQMKAILTSIVKKEKYQAKVNALQLEALKNEACRLCYAVLKGFDGTSFKPAFAELNFGNGEKCQLPAVSFDGTNVVLEGKIDRMDICDNMVRLIDYKTGQVDLSIDNLYYGKKVQLFAYLLSVMESGKYKPAGVFYLPIRSVFRKNSNMLEAYKLQGFFPGTEDIVFAMDNTLNFENPKSSLIDATLSTSKENKLLGKKVLKNQAHILKDNQLEDLAEYAKKVMKTAILEIKNGKIIASPLDKSGSRACEYCPFRAACKIDENPQNIRHEREKIDVSQIIGEE